MLETAPKIGERLRMVRGAVSLEEAAEDFGVHKNTLANYEKGTRIPDANFLNTVLEVFPEIDPAWLLTGEGAKLREEEISLFPHREEGREPGITEPEPAGGYVHVPRHKIAASACGGTATSSEQIVDYMTFRAAWMHGNLRLRPDQAAVISVVGDSMEPYLADGDLVLIDTSVAQIERDSIYVLQAGDSLVIKRIQKKLDGTLIISSDNPRYQPEMFQGDSVERIRVVGRMVRRLVR